ncbi:SGNH/GDSL hydrolase family protein [Caenimonas aquaedulcis]|uniref:SGNH/GDSL hydrolase family protein n=1 Tax=Caenimonas aquaedulcis TaxID=2793270 RepID=A0A931H5H3_9BURK|nr:SGNH/GDSL hydrolase family protein [Caenimonas aquaedulcis]MBG9388823.1 SGNH/GDSL hydrolase family protein [Caenimonas aquaedulcis]
MRLMKTRLAAIAAAIALVSCGGGDGGIEVSSTVSFGDSLSDVGTEKVGTIAALGGGKWTVNSATAHNWTEIVAASVHTTSCAAQTGLLPNIPGLVGAPVTNHPECTNYAQGSSRVSNPYGPNAAVFQGAPFNAVNLGLTALPVSAQMSLHLSRVGSYSGRELVTVMAGGNDAFLNLNAVASAAGGGATAVGAAVAAGWPAATQNAVAAGGAAAVNAAATQAVTSMGATGAELAGLVKSQVLAKGARYVMVVNLPDIAQSPSGMAADASTRSLITTMVSAFNQQLQAGLAGTPVLYIDAFTQGHNQYANPSAYGITNITTPACSTTSPANPLAGSSITCTAASTVAADVSGYYFADTVHPTPLGYTLLAQYVMAQMHLAGWI